MTFPIAGVLRTVLIAVALQLLLVPWAAEADTVYSISARDALLRVIDPADASTLSSVTTTLTGQTVQGGTGLARHPITGQLWALLKLTGQIGRQLVTIDPATGVATSIGNTGGDLAGLAFNAAATLFGVTGENNTGGLELETLYTLDTTTAAPTKVCNLGNGTDGEAIAFNTVTGLLHHASGHTGGGVIFETVDTAAACAITNIPITGSALQDEEAIALAFWPGPGVFLWSQNHDIPGKLFQVTPGGAPTLIGLLDHASKGLAVTFPRDHYLSYGITPTKGSPKFLPIPLVQLSDQFETGLFDVTKPKSLYNPADKNGEGVPDPTAHLKGYEIKLSKTTPVQPKHVPRNVQVTNQFPQALLLTTVKPERLLVPTTKCIDQPGNPCPIPLPPPNPVPVDHYKCYKIKISKGTPKFQPILGVSVSDQFTSPPKLFDLKALSRLCNPVDKNGEGVRDPGGHLLCYKATVAKGQPKHVSVKGVHLSNQFGEEQVYTVKEQELCVPSLKQLLPAAASPGLEPDEDEDVEED